MHKPTPGYTRTEDQDNIRLKWKAGCNAWNLLTQEQKNQWNQDADPYKITGFNYYMQQFMSLTTKSFYSVADTYVSEGFPFQNYGALDYMAIYDMIMQECQTLIKFDVSTIPPGSTIQSALLWVFYYAEAGTPGPNKVVYINRNLDDWEEMLVIWMDKPSFSPVETDSTILGYEGHWLQFDLKSDIQGFIGGTFPNRGWTIHFESVMESQETEALFRTKEATQHLPFLQVTYY